MVARSKSLKLLFSAETRSADAAEQLLITGLLMRIAENMLSVGNGRIRCLSK